MYKNNLRDEKNTDSALNREEQLSKRFLPLVPR